MHGVLNPASVQVDAARAALVAGVRAAGWPGPVLHLTSRDSPGRAQAEAAVAAGADVVCVAGGDGTVREVAHALAGTTTALGVLPVGTANLFAVNLGLRGGPLTRSVAVALHGAGRGVDVGRASWRPVEGGEVGRPTPEETFLVLAGIGHDAATVLATRPEFKRRLGWLAYLESGARHLLQPPLAMTISVDGAPARGVRTWCVLAANCGRLPGGVRVFPDARPDDGWLDTLQVPLPSPTHWAAVATKGVLGHRREIAALRYGRARTLWIIPGTPAPLQLDGDVVGTVADLRISLLPGALTVRTPDPTHRPGRPWNR